MRIGIALMLSTFGAFGQTSSAPVPATLDSAEALTRLREEIANSLSKGDFDRVLERLDTNVVVTWQNGEVSQGRESVRGYYDKMMKGERPIIREAKANLEISGRMADKDWAVAWGKMNDEFKLSDGNNLPLNSVFTATVARRGDQWVVTAFHTSVNAFDNPAIRVSLKKMGRTAVWGGTAGGVVLGLVLAKLFRRKKNDSPEQS